MSSDTRSESEKAFATAERKVRAAKKERRSDAIFYAVLAMMLLYFFDIVGLDNVVYFVVAGLDGVFGGDPWLPSVRGGLGTIKMVGFTGSGLFALYLARQEI